MSDKEKNFRLHDTGVYVWRDQSESWDTLNRILNLMHERGFTVGSDPRIQKEYPILSADHFYGRKGDLEFKAQRYPAGFKIEFYQNINTVNPNGGEYDFNKFTLMPYLMKKRFLVESRHIAQLLNDEGYSDESKPRFKTAHEKVMWRIHDDPSKWHKPTRRATMQRTKTASGCGTEK